MSHYDHNGTNLGDPRDTPDEKEIMRLLKRITSLTTELAAVKAERDALKVDVPRSRWFDLDVYQRGKP